MRRENITTPDLELNHRMLAQFDDGSRLYIVRHIDGYHTRGNPSIHTPTKAALDFAVSCIAEDRGGLSAFVPLPPSNS